jgi:hypothetical protein
MMVNTIMQLKTELGISVMEQHSVAMAFAYLHGAPSYVAQAALSKLKHQGRERGAMYAYSVLEAAYDAWNLEGKSSGRPQRYNMYWPMVLPSSSIFESNVFNSCKLCLRMFRDYPALPMSKIFAKKIYKRLCVLMREGVKNFGALGSNHLMAALAILGLVPEWTYHQCTLDPASEGYEYLAERFCLPKGVTGADPFFKSICKEFQVRYGYVSERLVENLICKIVQAEQKKKNNRKKNNETNKKEPTHFKDVVVVGQLLYVPRGHVVNIFSGNSQTSVPFHLLNKLFRVAGGVDQTMRQIAQAAIDTTAPEGCKSPLKKGCLSFTVPIELYHSTSI